MARNDTFSQWNTDTIGIGIIEDGGLEDPDSNSVTVTIVRSSDNTTVVSAGVATREDEGLYSYGIKPSTVTAAKSEYTATWEYEIGAVVRSFVYTFDVVDPQPFFDSLDTDQKQLVENIYHHVSDGFDSQKGGPYVWEMPQARFNFETVAKLLVVDAMSYINYASPKAFIPPFNLGASATKPFPIGWYGLLEKAAAYELYKHLATSYLEIPEPVGVNVAHLDRRDYYNRWMDRARIERDELDHMVKMLKRDFRFGVKSRSLLLAGGIFPVSYLNPARPRWPFVLTRFY